MCAIFFLFLCKVNNKVVVIIVVVVVCNTSYIYSLKTDSARDYVWCLI